MGNLNKDNKNIGKKKISLKQQKILKEKRDKLIKSVVLALVIISIFTVTVFSLLSNKDSFSFNRNHNLPTLIDFGSEGCIPCDNLQPVLAALRVKYNEQINIEFLDVNRSKAANKLSNEYEVYTIPTLIFLDKNGNEVKRVIGFHTQDELESFFRSLGWI